MGILKRMTVLTVALVVGCASNISDVLRDREAGKGTAVTYPIGGEQAWEVSRTVLRWCRANVIEEHKPEGYMVTELSDALGNNAYAGVWVKETGSTSASVTAITRRKDPLVLATPVTEAYFHRRFAQALKMLRAGQKLSQTPPAEPPD